MYKPIPASTVQTILASAPNQLRDKFHQLGRDYDALIWRTADCVTELYGWTMAANIPATIMDACNAAVAMMDADISAFTVYNWYLVGQKLRTPNQRRKYEALPVSHLLWARQYSESESAKVTFLEILNTDFALWDKSPSGRPPTLAALKEEITGNRVARNIRKAIESGAYSPPTFEIAADDDDAQALIKQVVEATEFISRAIQSPAFQASVKNAAESVLLSRIAVKASQAIIGMTALLREWSEQAVVNGK